MSGTSKCREHPSFSNFSMIPDYPLSLDLYSRFRKHPSKCHNSKRHKHPFNVTNIQMPWTSFPFKFIYDSWLFAFILLNAANRNATNIQMPRRSNAVNIIPNLTNIQMPRTSKCRERPSKCHEHPSNVMNIQMPRTSFPFKFPDYPFSLDLLFQILRTSFPFNLLYGFWLYVFSRSSLLNSANILPNATNFSISCTYVSRCQSVPFVTSPDQSEH